MRSDPRLEVTRRAAARGGRAATAPRRFSFALELAAGGRGCLFGNRADVPHERERVPLAPGLCDLAVRVVVVDGDALHRIALLPGGREAHELVLERPLTGPAHADLVAGLEDVLDRDVDVREGRAVGGDLLLARF